MTCLKGKTYYCFEVTGDKLRLATIFGIDAGELYPERIFDIKPGGTYYYTAQPKFTEIDKSQAESLMKEYSLLINDDDFR